MKVIYEAKDGTQFNTEEECQDYERRNSALYDISSFIATDKYGNHVPADGYGYSPDDFDYFCCFTEDGVKACEEFFRENGVPLSFKLEPNKVYYYDYNKEVWRPLSEKLDYLHSEYNRLSTLEEEILSTKLP